jgi:hypothetical protein
MIVYLCTKCVLSLGISAKEMPKKKKRDMQVKQTAIMAAQNPTLSNLNLHLHGQVQAC